ncbi:MAG: hypothetical protein REI94_06455 [Moraxellaceae bacterium]|nr:hypothetical protein [Moraxellaceae bacterium]
MEPRFLDAIKALVVLWLFYLVFFLALAFAANLVVGPVVVLVKGGDLSRLIAAPYLMSLLKAVLASSFVLAIVMWLFTLSEVYGGKSRD